MNRVAIAVLASGFLTGSLAKCARAEADPFCLQPPTVVVAVAPEVPDIAMRGRFFDVVVVDVLVDAAGSVTRATPQPGTRMFFGLADLAVRAAGDWKFNEAPGCEARVASLTFDFQRPVPIGTPGGSRFKPPYRVEVFRTDVLIDTRPIP